MKPECSGIIEKMFCILSIISLFTAKWKKPKGISSKCANSIIFVRSNIYTYKLLKNNKIVFATNGTLEYWDKYLFD